MKIKTSDTPDATRMELNPTRAARESIGTSLSSSISGNRTSSSDSIAISGTGSLVQQAINAGADDRAARVQALQQQYQSGNYQVDAIAVSRSLIAAHLSGE
ncbi:MAG TPA: flagellar biosynthesis anti-sigma factor FlgM [Bryobacteraceae bacterium]|nr:flagellar biosynthesis anti-sigma factor FlgM [Bryobacteraceae bacterium]